MAFDAIIVGGGTAGCVLAARLSEHAARRVLLLEAGPDYPSPAGLPPDIADGWQVAESHDWGYASEPDASGRVTPLLRGRLMGGCSSTNATLALRGFPDDYDEWAALGNPGWSWDEVLPFFRAAESDADFGSEPWHGDRGPLPIRRYDPDELNPFSVALLEAAAAAGHRPVDDHNRPGAAGVGRAPVNARDGLRLSTAMTYLAIARNRENLTIRPDTMVDRVTVTGARVTGVRIAEPAEVVEAGTVVLAAGAYASPAILARSGIGPADDLAAMGIPVVADLGGVGANLVDHPFASLDVPLSVDVRHEPKFQALVTWRSSGAGATGPPDMHLVGAGPWPGGPSGAIGAIAFSVLKPRSRGWVRLRSPDARDAPRIDPAHLRDAGDRSRMVEGLLEARRVARTSPLAGLVSGDELGPASGIADDDAPALESAVGACVGSYHHPVGTCRMGPDPDAGAVVDARGHVYGIERLVVADASIMPAICAANTNLPTVMIAERMAAFLRD